MAPQFDRALRDLLRAAGCALVRQGKGSHEIWHSRSLGETSRYRSGFRAAIRPMPFCDRRVCRRPF